MYLLDFQFRSVDDWLRLFSNGVDLRFGNGRSLLGIGCLDELDSVYNLPSKLEWVGQLCSRTVWRSIRGSRSLSGGLRRFALLYDF